jgi:hypothetical protein
MIEHSIIINGRLVGPRNVELDEPVDSLQGEVEVTLRPRGNGKAGAGEPVSDFLRRVPAGTRSREEIDRGIHQERDAWEARK